MSIQQRNAAFAPDSSKTILCNGEVARYCIGEPPKEVHIGNLNVNLIA